MKIYIMAFLLIIIPSLSSASLISYEAIIEDSGEFKYVYELKNNTNYIIDAFNIKFDSPYIEEDTLKITTPDRVGSSWDEIFLRPGIGVPPEYDVFAMEGGLLPGQSIYGFTVIFSWNGPNLWPGAQAFEIYDGETFEVITSGYTTPKTVPEPSSLILILFSLITFYFFRKTNFQIKIKKSTILLAASIIPSLAHSQVIIENYELVDSKRIDRYNYEYTYNVKIENLYNETLRNTTATLSSNNPGLDIKQKEIIIGELSENETRNVEIKITHNRRYSFNKDDLEWTFLWSSQIKDDEILSEISKNIEERGGKLEATQTAFDLTVDIPENVNRGNQEFIISELRSEGKAQLFMNENPEIERTIGNFIRIYSSGNIEFPISINIKFHDNMESQIQNSTRLEVFALTTQHGDNEEELISFEKVGAAFNKEKNTLSATIPAHVFEPISSVFTNLVVAQYQENNNESPVTEATVSNFTPSGSMEVFDNETIMISGDINFLIPPQLSSPLSGPLETTSSFGLRTHPVTNKQKSSHKGTDFRANQVPVFPAAAGQILLSGAQRPCEIWVQKKTGPSNQTYRVCMDGYGHRVTICHPTNSNCQIQTRYGHLEPYGLPSTGSFVTESQQIGVADTTGTSSGPHLHFECRVVGRPFDCEDFLNKQDSEKYLSNLKIVTKINGQIIQESIKQVTSNNFSYDASINLSRFSLEKGQHTLSTDIIDATGTSQNINTLNLTIKNRPLRVTLRWSTYDTDVDLRVSDNFGRESSYQNFCGVPGGCLDVDDTDGFGPEVFNLQDIREDSLYSVIVHYFSDHGNGPTSATVTVEQDEQVIGTYSRVLSDGEYWFVGDYPQ